MKNSKQFIKTKIRELIREVLNEIRNPLMNYLKEKLPNTPEYIIQDLFYKNLKDSNRDEINELISEYQNIKWELKYG